MNYKYLFWYKFEDQEFDVGLGKIENDGDVITIRKMMKNASYKVLEIYIEHGVDNPFLCENAIELMPTGLEA